MFLVICPGFHDPRLTDRFLECLKIAPDFILPPFSFLPPSLSLTEPLIPIGFSAGVITASLNARLHAARGGKIKALIALDGWGVPLYGNFPIYRLSRDYFTHWSSLLTGGDDINFYADPPVEHLAFWSSIDRVPGRQRVGAITTRTDALSFLTRILNDDLSRLI